MLNMGVNSVCIKQTITIYAKQDYAIINGKSARFILHIYSSNIVKYNHINNHIKYNGSQRVKPYSFPI